MQLLSSKKIDITIVGAGPQALTLVTHLLQKKPQWGSRLMIFDPSGTWLSEWKQQFRAQEIPHLRCLRQGLRLRLRCIIPIQTRMV